MKPQIETIRKTRSFLLEQIKNLDNEQFNQVAEGFNNNIAWNLGHMIATQQGMCYKRAGLPTVVSEEFWEKFRTGSKPQGRLSDEEIIHIKDLLLTTLDNLENDYNNKIFGNYTAWSTRYGVEITCIDDALEFLPFHEGLHAGTIGAIKRLVA
ncbi:MAG TPA: DinB family protein [Puia sp.]|nr:DinB family protein [Puia sp.]